MEKFIELQKNDNDKKKTWGGKVTGDIPAYNVHDLQGDLKKVGTFTEVADGDFGDKTQKALKFFQWCCANMDAYTKDKSRVARSLKPSISVSGILNRSTYDELMIWVKNSQVVTGDLIRVAFSDLSNLEASSGFKKLSSTSVLKDELVISSGALQLIKDLNKHAKAKKITIKINQAFRIHGVNVTGAVVPPATKSQHLIGHAIDCNIVDGGNWNNSAAFKNNKATENAKNLIKEMKKSGFRWGGDFAKVDTPHFDYQISSTNIAYDVKFFLNQRVVSEGHNIPKALITKETK